MSNWDALSNTLRVHYRNIAPSLAWGNMLKRCNESVYLVAAIGQSGTWLRIGNIVTPRTRNLTMQGVTEKRDMCGVSITTFHGREWNVGIWISIW